MGVVLVSVARRPHVAVPDAKRNLVGQGEWISKGIHLVSQSVSQLNMDGRMDGWMDGLLKVNLTEEDQSVVLATLLIHGGKKIKKKFVVYSN